MTSLYILSSAVLMAIAAWAMASEPTSNGERQAAMFFGTMAAWGFVCWMLR